MLPGAAKSIIRPSQQDVFLRVIIGYHDCGVFGNDFTWEGFFEKPPPRILNDGYSTILKRVQPFYTAVNYNVRSYFRENYHNQKPPAHRLPRQNFAFVVVHVNFFTRELFRLLLLIAFHTPNNMFQVKCFPVKGGDGEMGPV